MDTNDFDENDDFSCSEDYDEELEEDTHSKYLEITDNFVEMLSNYNHYPHQSFSYV